MSSGVLERGGPGWPQALELLDRKLPRLWYQGDLRLLGRRMVAIVGSRHPTPYGLRVAYQAGRAMGEAGIVVVSGLALGLDAQAHLGALDGGGDTVAVLGGGLEQPTPLRNRALRARMAERGLILTEFAPGTETKKWMFPWRNRIIVALAERVLIVEGKVKGGTSTTAGWAADLNKDLWAVPGRIDDEVARGPLKNLRAGAQLYGGPDDLREAFGLPRLEPDDLSDAPDASVRRCAGASAAVHPREALTGAEADLYDVLTPEPVHADVLAARTALQPSLLLAALTSLELQGLAVQLPGKRFALAS